MTTRTIERANKKLWLAAIKPPMYSVAIMPIWVGSAVPQLQRRAERQVEAVLHAVGTRSAHRRKTFGHQHDRGSTARPNSNWANSAVLWHWLYLSGSAVSPELSRPWGNSLLFCVWPVGVCGDLLQSNKSLVKYGFGSLDRSWHRHQPNPVLLTL